MIIFVMCISISLGYISESGITRPYLCIAKLLLGRQVILPHLCQHWELLFFENLGQFDKLKVVFSF